MKKNLLASLVMLMTLLFTTANASDKTTFDEKVNSLVADNNFIATYKTLLSYASKADMESYYAAIKAKDPATWTKVDKERVVKYLGYKNVNEMKGITEKLRVNIEELIKSHPELISNEHRTVVTAALEKSVKLGKLTVTKSAKTQIKPDCFTQWLMDNAFCSAAIIDNNDYDFYAWCIMMADTLYFACENIGL